MTRLERLIISWKPIAFVLNKTKQVILPGFRGIPLFDVMRFFYRQLKTTSIGQRAAAISYNLLMAIPAGLIFLFTIVPHLPKAIRQDFISELFKLIYAYFAPNPATEKWLRAFVSDFVNTQRGTLSIIGFLLVLWATSNAMIGITKSFDHSVTLKKDKNFFQHRWTAAKLTTLLITMVIASVILLISEGALLKVILRWVNLESGTVKTIVRLLDWLVIIALSFFSIGLIYRYAPSNHKRWRIVTPGSILTTFLLLLTTFLFSYWVNRFSNYNEIYGSIGTVLILMVLIYFNSLVLLIGFELNISISSLKYEAEQREKREQEAASQLQEKKPE
jgi:membrane protein